jgi:hypothetical protein
MAGPCETEFPPSPAAEAETRLVVPVWRSRQKMSPAELGSVPPPGTRFVARLANATYRPSALMTGSKESWLAGPPSAPTLTRVSAPVRRSRTKMSWVEPLGSAEVRLDAQLSKTT